jgi:hypothetical protein
MNKVKTQTAKRHQIAYTETTPSGVVDVFYHCYSPEAEKLLVDMLMLSFSVRYKVNFMKMLNSDGFVIHEANDIPNGVKCNITVSIQIVDK